MEVKYSINGIPFNEKGNQYKIFVSNSEGLIGKLKPKAKSSYEWAEQHGVQVNTLQKTKYEARTITLDCWVKGTDWRDMKNNFDRLMSEFDKPGTQRLLVNPFEADTPLVYDVVLDDATDLKKRFEDGEMVGTFTLKMVEQRPIKKILFLDGTKLSLSFNVPSLVVINIDGIWQSAKGEVKIDKELVPGKHYISISGNIEEITNLTSNAKVIWERL